MNFSILTLFPDFFNSPLQESILKRAIEKKQISVETINIRDFADNNYKRVDAKPFGGGAGMLMQAEPIAKAVENVKNNINKIEENKKFEVIFFTPSAPELTQKDSYELAQNNTHKIFLCGHYEGVDQRVLDKFVDKSFSVGKTVLTGGEIPALLCLDSIVRLLPNVISKETSHQRETFSSELYGKGEYPQFTRPENWRGIEVPKVLLSGNHADIEKYQFENLQNCTDTEKQNILFREKYKNNKIKNLSDYTSDKKVRNIYLELVDFNNDLEVLKFKIFDKKTKFFISEIELYIEKNIDFSSLEDLEEFIFKKILTLL